MLTPIAQCNICAQLAPMWGTYQPVVFMMAARRHGPLHIGTTPDLAKRAWLYRERLLDCRAGGAQCRILVWYELHASMEAAEGRQQGLEALPRAERVALIDKRNPQWSDLFREVCR